jgi:hypothetical protein
MRSWEQNGGEKGRDIKIGWKPGLMDSKKAATVSSIGWAIISTEFGSIFA